MEMLFSEKYIRPEIEHEIRQGFFEIKKKYTEEEFNDKNLEINEDV